MLFLEPTRGAIVDDLVITLAVNDIN